jgi:pyruvate/2-oxoglutarate dehydrogenase complex dihydrolipoamide acyltransferase (E2) component
MSTALETSGVSTTPQAAPLPTPSPANPLIPLKGLCGSIARNMTAGWQAPRIAMGIEVDMSRCNALQAQAKSANILGISRVVDRAVVRDGQVGSRQ